MNRELEQLISRIVPGMQGWCTVDKALAMAELIITTDAHLVVELGVFGGRSLVPQAMALRDLCANYSQIPCEKTWTIYGIDPWKKESCLEGTNDKKNDEWWAGLDLEDIHRGCMKAIRDNGLDLWVTVIRSTAEQSAALFNQPIDILHIDGNHSELASVRDVTTWLPKVKTGGHIWMDDTDWHTTGKAVALLTENCDAVKDVGSCRLFKKR